MLAKRGGEYNSFIMMKWCLSDGSTTLLRGQQREVIQNIIRATDDSSTITQAIAITIILKQRICQEQHKS